MLPRPLAALEFRSNNTAHAPVVEALTLLRCYADRPGATRPPTGCRSTGWCRPS